MAKTKVCNQSKQDAAWDGYSIRMPAWHARQARKLSDKKELGDGVRKAIELAVKAIERGVDLEKL